jgi:hypothetical protein
VKKRPAKTIDTAAAGGSLPNEEWAKLSQREKFIRTAREVGADETGEALDEALRAVGRARKR